MTHAHACRTTRSRKYPPKVHLVLVRTGNPKACRSEKPRGVYQADPVTLGQASDRMHPTPREHLGTARRLIRIQMVLLEGFGWSQPPQHIRHLTPEPRSCTSAPAGGKHSLLKGPTMDLGTWFLRAPTQTSSLGYTGMPQHGTLCSAFSKPAGLRDKTWEGFRNKVGK